MTHLQHQSMSGARIYVGEMHPREQEVEGLPSRAEIAAAAGYKHVASLNNVVRESMMRLQLRLVAERVAKALPTWGVNEASEVVAYAVENRLGGALVWGDLTVAELVEHMREAA